MLIPAAKGCS